jgi:Domain of unknown function (DUF1992)
MPRLELVEDEISRNLAQALASGELRNAKGYGAPLIEGEGWSDTPGALRMPFKILKDAGVVPHEVEMMKERAQLREQLEIATEPEQKRTITRSCRHKIRDNSVFL